MTATATATTRPRKDRVAAKAGIILHVGCGSDKHPGAVGLDRRSDVEIDHDPGTLPWPLQAESVLTILAVDIVQRINPANGHFVAWMNECWRVLQPDRQLMIVTPYAGSPPFWADPAAVNGCTHQTFWRFDPVIELARPDGTKSVPYRAHEPAPWQIQSVFYQAEGTLEVALCKRVDEPGWHADGKVHYR